MRVQTLLGVLSMTSLVAWGVTWGPGCGGGSTVANDGGMDSTTNGGTAGKGGSAGTGAGGGSGTGAGGASGTGANGSAGTGAAGTKGAGGTMGTGAGGASGSGAVDAGGDANVFVCSGTDCCPTTPCPKGDKCCANVKATDAGAAFQCNTTCAADDTLDCTAHDDCTGGDVCCVTAVFSGTGSFPGCLTTNIQNVSSTCSPGGSCASDLKVSCSATDTARLCNTSKDCTEKGYTLCCELPLGSRTYAACVPPIAKTLDKSLVCD